MKPTIDHLAKSLGVSAQSLESLGARRNGTAWEFPERDDQGEVIGWARRLDSGGKKMKPKSKRGLTMVWPLENYAGSSPAAPILVVEGQTDTAAGTDLGFVTIGRPSCNGGANLLTALLADRHVVVVAENDGGPGLNGAHSIASKLTKRAASVKVVSPPEEVKDLREWYQGGTNGIDHDLLLELIRREPAFQDTNARSGPVLVCLADVAPQPISWLWQRRIARGKLTLIVGDPDVGKSHLTIDIAARVTQGDGWPDHPRESSAPGDVIFLAAEDDLADTIRPRLDAAGADPRRVHAIKAERRFNPDSDDYIDSPITLKSIPVIEQSISRLPNCRLLIIDPISAYLGGVDEHKNAAVRGLIMPLTDMASRHGIAVIAVTHLRKSEGAAMHRSMGSLGFIAAARSAWLVAKAHEDPAGQRRYFLPMKNNIALSGSGLAYRIESCEVNPAVGCVRWEPDAIEISADEALAIPPSKRGPAPTDRDEAAEWLKRRLADGKCLATELYEEAQQSERIAKTTLIRAKKALGIKPFREQIPGPWWWQLPVESSDEL